METYERIRYLRKNVLKMSQTEFGERLGVNRSVIKNIELNVLARPDQKLSLLKLIAREFNVREEWLLTGEEPMEAPPETFSLDAFCKERGASELELDIVKAYFSLSDETRKEIMDNFSMLFSKTPVETEAAEIPNETPRLTEEEIEAQGEAFKALLRGEQKVKRQLDAEVLRYVTATSARNRSGTFGGSGTSGSSTKGNIA